MGFASLPLDMPSKLILDPAEPGISEVVAGAAVGEPLLLRSVSVVPTRVDADLLEADIAEISVDEVPEVEAEEPEAPAVPQGMPMENKGQFDEGVF